MTKQEKKIKDTTSILDKNIVESANGVDSDGRHVLRTSECSHSIDKRLATIEGHIRAIRKMLDEAKCIDILTQLMAVEGAIKKTGIVLLKSHMNTCIKDAVDKGDSQTVNELGKILEMYL